MQVHESLFQTGPTVMTLENGSTSGDCIIVAIAIAKSIMTVAPLIKKILDRLFFSEKVNNFLEYLVFKNHFNSCISKTS